VLNAIRWLLVLPLAVFAWVCVFVATLTLHSAIDTFCPPEYLVSGMCTWKWAFLIQDALVVAGASISAIVMILVATLTAPSHKARTAVFIYLGGLSVAIWMYLQTDAIGAFTGAACFGLLATWIAFRRLSRRPGLTDPYQRRLFV
jgi:hypothetical protein